MKSLPLLISLLLCACISKAQKITYEFPKPVVEKLQSYTENNLLEPDHIYALELTTADSGRYIVSVHDYKKDTTDIVYRVIVQNSSRSTKIGKIEMPVVSSEDFVFADFGTVYDPTNKNPKRRVGKRKIVRSFDGYSIKFDHTGKIY